MRTHVAALTVEDLEEFLKKNGRDINTKDYEFYAALILAKLYGRQFGKKCRVAFPTKREKTREVLPDETIEVVQKVLRACLDEDSPFDVFILPEDEFNKINERKKRPQGNPFQLKRLKIPCKDLDVAESIAKYLNEVIPKKYGHVPDAALVLLLEHSTTNTDLIIDLGKVQKLFQPKAFPFSQVLFIVGGNEKLVSGEFWPNFGRQEYTRADFF
jgi:hypothetical protein